MRFRQGVILPLSMKKHMWVVTRSNRGEISPRGDFTSVLKTKAIFHPGINSVWFHSVTAINFHPSLILCAIRDHLFSTYAKFSEKLIFHTPWYAHVRNVSFSENLAYVLNRWTLLWLIQKILSHYHYFFVKVFFFRCNMNVSTFGVFFKSTSKRLSKVYFRRSKNWK